MTLLERVTTTVSEELGVDQSEVLPDSSFVDLGADSMDMASLMLAIEDEVGIDIPQDDAQRLFTVQDAVNYVHQRSIAN